MRALAAVALWQVDAASVVVTGLGGTLVDVDLAASSGETGGTVALHAVPHGDAEAAVLARVLRALDGLALVASNCAGPDRPHVGGALQARQLAGQRLVEVPWAGCARSKTSIGVLARRAFCCFDKAESKFRRIKKIFSSFKMKYEYILLEMYSSRLLNRQGRYLRLQKAFPGAAGW